MNGYEYLFRVIEGRIKQLLLMENRARKLFGDKYKSMPAEFLAREGVAGIILGIGHGLADDSEFNIPDFGMFLGKEENGEYSARFLEAVALSCYILNIRSELGFTDWENVIGQRPEIDDKFVQNLVSNVLKSNFVREGKFEVRISDVSRIANLILWTFFDTVFNSLILGKKIVLSGLGTFVRGQNGEVKFTPAERITDAVKLFYLRQKPLPSHPGVVSYTIGPTQEEIDAILNMDVDVEAQKMMDELRRSGAPKILCEQMLDVFRKRLEAEKQAYAKLKKKPSEEK